jgi:hypothetical protein
MRGKHYDVITRTAGITHISKFPYQNQVNTAFLIKQLAGGMKGGIV